MEQRRFSIRCLFLGIYTLLILKAYCTTHWVVTEDGKIQAQMDSIFQLRRPYDFLALAQQEQRAMQVESLKRDLVSQKSQIDRNEDKDTQLEERIYRTDSDCVLAGRPLTEFDLYASTGVNMESAGIRLDDHLGPSPGVSDFLQEPDCISAYDLPFSMFAYEHLQGVRFRDNLTTSVEEELSTVGGEADVSVWGHRVATALTTNNSSWVLYTLATQYWRVKADPFQAVECVRRALHFAPRNYRYIAKVHLGNILHRARRSDEAVLVLHAAIDHYRHSPVAHITLGNVYATLAFYNVSVLCFENALYMSPGDQSLRRRKHAVLCHSKLEAALENQHQSLQRTLGELRDYQKRHEEWLSLQQKLLLEQATPEMKLESRLEYEEQKIRESTDGRDNLFHLPGQDCFQYQQDGHTFLSCNMRRDQLEQRGSPSELLLDLQSLLHTVESEALRLGQHVLKRKPLLISQVPQIMPLHPTKTYRNGGTPGILDMTLGEGFPTAEQCEKAPLLPQWDDFPSVFLPAENKGFSVDRFLSDDIDVSFNEEHPLPWHPPICERLADTVEGIDDIPGIKERHTLTTRNRDPHAVPYLMKYGYQGVEAEIGQRISSAMKRGVGPQWLLYNLAGLYWRVHGNLYNGVECLRRAVATAPDEWRDVPLVNIAALLYTAGHIDDALTLTLQAMQVADHEPETNFLLANLYCGKGNLTGAWHHYERVLAASPNHSSALQFLTALACHTRPPHSIRPLPTCQNQGGVEDGVCTTDGGCQDSTGAASTEEKSDVDDVISLDLENEAEEETEAEASPTLPQPELTEEENLKDLGNPQGPEAKAGLPNKQIHVRIGLGTEDSTATYTAADAESASNPDTPVIEDDPLPDVLLRVRERVASPPPPPHVCDRANKLSEVKHFTSTWLSVSAKNIDISEYLVASPAVGTALEEPICRGDLPASMHTLDHLAGIRHRHLLPHFPEMGLREALQTLTDRTPVSVDLMATRIARSLQKNETSWVVATAAALYWRVVGSGERAVDCLRHTLHHAPRHMKDIPLISLANILHRAGLYNNALVVANMALEISPKFVVIHFTMANIYAAKGDLEKATAFYQSTLALQSSFEPARDRLRAIQCATLSEEISVKNS
ncbi:tetratricopeptide repeat protein 17 isoform X1 [Procambarus clarkii]|uniref:tetratricopeptide repeat protein 17 isoform X1 n=1 Tax=Procambarus clarkii TaxID=6728 RepID=UPI0037421145